MPKRQRGALDGRIEGKRRKPGRCPICGKPAEPEHRPFCSKRCAEIDLGRWLKGAYSVPGEKVSRTDEEDD